MTVRGYKVRNAQRNRKVEVRRRHEWEKRQAKQHAEEVGQEVLCQEVFTTRQNIGG